MDQRQIFIANPQNDRIQVLEAVFPNLIDTEEILVNSRVFTTPNFNPFMNLTPYPLDGGFCTP